MNRPISPTVVAGLGTTVHIRTVIDVVSRRFDVAKTAILSSRRDLTASAARHMAIWMARRTTSRTLSEIGRMFGRDHTTVMHAVAKLEAAVLVDADLAALAREIEIECRAVAMAAVTGLLSSPVDREAFGVAQAVCDDPRAATNVSIDEIRALASAVISLSQDEADLREELAKSTAYAEVTEDALFKARAHADELQRQIDSHQSETAVLNAARELARADIRMTQTGLAAERRAWRQALRNIVAVCKNRGFA